MARGRDLGRDRLGPQGGQLTWLQDSLGMISLMAVVAVPGRVHVFLFPAPSLIFISHTMKFKKDKKDPNFQIWNPRAFLQEPRLGLQGWASYLSLTSFPN